LHLAAPIPVIEAAVMARNVSSRRQERAAGEALYGSAPQPVSGLTLDDLEQALIAGKILCYAQGFAMMTAAARDFGWALQMPAIARVWRAGCIIRSTMLNDMATALTDDAGRNLILAPFFADHLRRTIPALRKGARIRFRPAKGGGGGRAERPRPSRTFLWSLVVRSDAHCARHREHDPGPARFLRPARV
jgi:6-phosphogluconate dehydrogenase